MFQITALILLSLGFGAATAYFANERGRDPLLWFMVGMFFGIFGLIFLFVLPTVQRDALPDEAEYALLESQSEIAPAVQDHQYMIKEWFYYDQQQERHGPVAFETLKTLWKKGEVNDETYIWSEGLENWKKIEEVQGVYAHLQLAAD